MALDLAGILLQHLHGSTCKDEGVLVYVRGGELFASQVHNPVTELVVTRCDKADPLTVKGMADGKSGVAAATVMSEVWGI